MLLCKQISLTNEAEEETLNLAAAATTHQTILMFLFSLKAIGNVLRYFLVITFWEIYEIRNELNCRCAILTAKKQTNLSERIKINRIFINN